MVVIFLLINQQQKVRLLFAIEVLLCFSDREVRLKTQNIVKHANVEETVFDVRFSLACISRSPARQNARDHSR